jgi:hypothetical protein
MPSARRFPSPWTIEEANNTCFIVRDNNGQALGYFYLEDELGRRSAATRALQAYLGHRNIQHTVRYTELSPTRFKDFWRR